jgi:hypothetical protein
VETSFVLLAAELNAGHSLDDAHAAHEPFTPFPRKSAF